MTLILANMHGKKKLVHLQTKLKLMVSFKVLLGGIHSFPWKVNVEKKLKENKRSFFTLTLDFFLNDL